MPHVQRDVVTSITSTITKINDLSSAQNAGRQNNQHVRKSTYKTLLLLSYISDETLAQMLSQFRDENMNYLGDLTTETELLAIDSQTTLRSK